MVSYLTILFLGRPPGGSFTSNKCRFFRHSYSENFKHAQNVGTRSTYNKVYHCVVCLFVWVEALLPSQQFFSNVPMEPPLPGNNQYFFGR